MQDIKLIFAYSLDNPEKQYAVCDLNQGKVFLDPLILFNQPWYDPYNANKEGLYAIGGEITPETLETSYKWGIFPWFAYKSGEEVYWYCPEERYVIFPEQIHVSHSLRSLLNKKKYHITVNKAFKEVIHNCRYVNERDSHESAWLSSEIEKCFIELYKRGFAKSVEVWEGEELVGGFYGFFYKGIFEGDSMFSLKPSSSQIGLIELCRNPYIDGEKIKLIDTQFETPTFQRLGGSYISYRQYRETMDSSNNFVEKY